MVLRHRVKGYGLGDLVKLEVYAKVPYIYVFFTKSDTGTYHLSTASYYAEQYMGSAVVANGNNYGGYEDSSLLEQPERYRNRTLFVAHGSADRDAHVFHTLKFTKHLSSKGILFK